MTDLTPIHVPSALDQLVDAMDYAIIGPSDGRRRIANASLRPYSSICLLTRTFIDGRVGRCTGFLVAPTVVLTAGHCVYSRRRANPRPTSIRITPGRNGSVSTALHGTQLASRWYVHRDYVRSGNPSHDLGIIVLPKPFAKLKIGFKLQRLSDGRLNRLGQNNLLNIAGYPADKSRGEMWHHAERLDRTTHGRLYYSVDTCPGHSGAPVWISSRGSKPSSVVAIHVSGPPTHPGGTWGCVPGVPMAPRGQSNIGMRITESVRECVIAGTLGRVVLPNMMRLR